MKTHSFDTHARSRLHTRGRSTPLFLSYVAQLIVRALVFAAAVYLLVTMPSHLDPFEYFGFKHGLSFVDIVFALLVIDAASKLYPSAKIAMGSLKQYRTFHKPTQMLVKGGRDEILSYLRTVQDDGKAIAGETVEGMRETARVLAQGSLLDAGESAVPVSFSLDEALRHDIRRKRLHEIIPVVVFWIVFNALIAVLLAWQGWLTVPVCFTWMLFYFLFDMICVVAWCPLQLVLMRNRCCTTCQIFNWDAAMTATPLIFVGGLFSWIVGILAVVVLVRWELAFVRHPERFDERTNASLACANCTDHFCRLRGPLAPERVRR